MAVKDRRLPSQNVVSILVVNADSNAFVLILFGIENTLYDPHILLTIV
jgi:hypothetical protein